MIALHYPGPTRGFCNALSTTCAPFPQESSASDGLTLRCCEVCNISVFGWPMKYLVLFIALLIVRKIPCVISLMRISAVISFRSGATPLASCEPIEPAANFAARPAILLGQLSTDYLRNHCCRFFQPAMAGITSDATSPTFVSGFD